ncbi:unnamed protein product [Dimorphilus gyrociliatus]|uniref:Uncharacterized protein n=1 Tax=Dimorphilus gyrociliatus TaxID=2664684 RepID=A0A7I8V9I8_9ANNE|nr:unnamed protein product [Dimorphilus gyrociliatus]
MSSDPKLATFLLEDVEKQVVIASSGNDGRLSANLTMLAGQDGSVMCVLANSDDDDDRSNDKGLKRKSQEGDKCGKGRIFSHLFTSLSQPKKEDIRGMPSC